MNRRIRILFTGASSFTGFWFARTLAQSGHSVVCLFTQEGAAAYSGLRRRRVELLLATPGITPIWGKRLSDPTLPDHFRDGSPWDVFCHHAAEVTDYKSPDFNPLAAAETAVAGLPAMLSEFRKAGGKALVFSGTYFESGQGTEGEAAPAFSPYAVSKTLSGELARFYAEQRGLGFTKFVMPNPFGPYEERGFTRYLAAEWLAGRTPAVKTPDYLRDNMPVPLMARDYVRAVQESAESPRYRSIRPSGYTGRQGDFALEFAARLSPHLGDCPLKLETQKDFAEPCVRLNAPASHAPEWSPLEADIFWTELADFYRSEFSTA